MIDGVFDAKAIAGMVPMSAPGRPEEVADLVGFLASEQASYISGQIISVNEHDLIPPAHALAVHQTEALLFFTLLQLTVIVLAARLGGDLAQRIGQSPAVGEIIVGILLGPSLFGLLAPSFFNMSFIRRPRRRCRCCRRSAWCCWMFQIGLEFDFAHLTARSNRRAVTLIASASMVAALRARLRLRLAARARCCRPASTRSPRRCSSPPPSSITALPISAAS